MSINIKKCCIVMIMAHRQHIRDEEEKWKTGLEINMQVKIINVMTGRKRNRTDSYLLQLVIHILNVLTKYSLFRCFSFYYFTVLWKHCKSEFTVYSHLPRQEGSLQCVEFEFFPKFNKWVNFFDKQGVRKFFSKETSLLSV